MLVLFLMFTVVPLVELWLLFRLSGVFGFWTTISLVLLTGLVGASLARWQGWLTMQRIQNDLQQGILPAKKLGDGALILVAGVLLITPGVITDGVGLALLVPPIRSGVRHALQLWIAKNVRVESHTVWGETRSSSDPNVVQGRVIDATIVESDDRSDPETTHGPSPQ